MVVVVRLSYGVYVVRGLSMFSIYAGTIWWVSVLTKREKHSTKLALQKPDAAILCQSLAGWGTNQDPYHTGLVTSS